MIITHKSEWLHAQKHADLMTPGEDFQVMQTTTGTSVFFSLGTDGVLYMCKELPGATSSWSRQDISSKLAGVLMVDKVAVKAFRVVQHPVTLRFDLGLAVTSGTGSAQTDDLFLCLDHADTDADWDDGVISWRHYAFDAAGENRQQLLINDVMMLYGSDSSTLTCIVDIAKNDAQVADSIKLLERYYIECAAGDHRWVRHTLPINLESGRISSVPGWRADDPISGVYTLGTIGGVTELVFGMRYNYFDTTGLIAPDVVNLPVPAGATAMTTSINAENYTSLYVSGESGIDFFAPDKQNGLEEKAIRILSDPLTMGSTDLQAMTAGGSTALWGVGASGRLWYTHCPAGKEAVSAEWATVIPLLVDVENYAFYTGSATGKLTLFAHTQGSEIIVLVQDPVTLGWEQRRIMIPGTDINDMVEFASFTTRILVKQDDGTPGLQVPLDITASSPIGVYINNVYHVLHPTSPVTCVTDAFSAITIVQPASGLSAVCYTVRKSGDQSGGVLINPSAQGLERLQNIKTISDLDAATVRDPQTGETCRLLPVGTDDDTKRQFLSSLQQIFEVKRTLPQDGTPIVEPAPSSPIQSIEVPPQDLFSKIKHGIEKVFDCVIEAVGGVWHFVCKIAEKAYHAVLDCLSAVGHAMEWLFEKIKVGVEKVIRFLSFLFDWDDIVRTHNVLKSFCNNFALSVLDDVANLEHRVDAALKDADDKVRNWAGLKIADDGKTIGGSLKDLPGNNSDSPQAHWGIQHFTQHRNDASVSAAQPLSVPDDIANEIRAIFVDLEAVIEKEGDILLDAFRTLKDDIFAHIQSLTPIQLLQKLMALAASVGLQTLRNVLVKAIDIFRHLGKIVLDLLNLPFEIPILSPLYKRISGNDLTVLDVCCLIAAIPVNVIYKAGTGQTPFPDDARTKQLIASDSMTMFLSGLMDKPAPRPQLRQLFSVHAPGHVETALAVRATGMETEDREPGEIKGKAYRAFLSVADILGGVGAGLWVWMAAQENPASDALAATTLAFERWKLWNIPAWILFIAPNIVGDCEFVREHWGVGMDTAVYSITLLKVLADRGVMLVPQATSIRDGWKRKAGPIIDVASNLLWIVAARGKFSQTKMGEAQVLALAASILADIGGVGYGVRDWFEGKDEKIMAVGAFVGMSTTTFSALMALGSFRADVEDAVNA